jgi:DNA-directed RNA polymerase specialized sigma24 family protein
MPPTHSTTPRLLDPADLGRHLDRLFRAARAMCGSHADAEDLVQ